ncbi:MAG: hypothetical protein KAS63_04100 [Candidatus Heimdallarchaeota archaeon]|nr:hypothetical protein [Candidatus Heimdallarchaeota archaeon]MCK4954517.1 hypothetical protein [Candidatus Heimdallarchaeota archaeon]
MARKLDYIKWGKILSIVGGILFVIGGALLLIAHFVGNFTLNPIASDIIIKTPFYSFGLRQILLAIIGIVLGALTIILVTLEISVLATGILLIVIGILGLGFPGLFVFIGGILYIIASTKKR